MIVRGASLIKIFLIQELCLEGLKQKHGRDVTASKISVSSLVREHEI